MQKKINIPIFGEVTVCGGLASEAHSGDYFYDKYIRAAQHIAQLEAERDDLMAENERLAMYIQALEANTSWSVIRRLKAQTIPEKGGGDEHKKE